MDPITGGVVAAAADLVKTSFDNVFRELNLSAETWFQRLKITSFDRDSYADYVLRNVGVFPLFGTTKWASVETGYIRVGVTADIERLRYRPHAEVWESLKQQRTGIVKGTSERGDHLLDLLAVTTSGVALMGLPGSGKTTALRSLAVAAAKGEPVAGKSVLPLFMMARDMATETTSIHQAAYNFLKSVNVSEHERVLVKLLKRGDLLLLLDGIDEVDTSRQHRLLRELTDLHAEYPRTRSVVSARPYSLDVALPAFIKCEMLPLSLSERMALIRKWFAAVDASKGDRFIKECGEEPGLVDLGSSPLLLSMVCALYANDLKIPSEPDELYARLIDGLLGTWDAFRNVARQTVLRDLSVRRRLTLASWLAADMFDAGRRVFTAADISSVGLLDRFSKATRTSPLQVDDVLRAFFNDFGILVERAAGLFSFSHLTFQEYLTAQYVVDNRRELHVLERRLDREWFEVVRLVAKLLPRADGYMRRLTIATDVADVYELALLQSCWSVHPLCDPAVARDAFAELGRKIASEFTHENRSGSEERRQRILEQLPLIVSILTRGGYYSLEDLQLSESEPFRRPMLWPGVM